MAQLPDGNEPGYESLRERVETALSLNSESPSLEFKAGTSWNALKRAVIKTVLAMSNLRDGGLIVIGRAEADDYPEGVSAEHLLSFEPDVMRDQFDSYADPRTIFLLAKFDVNGATYIAVEVSEFDDVPVVCVKASDDGYFRKGAIYVRPFSGRPRSVEAGDADEIRSVIELAIDKGISNFENRAARRGFARQPEDQDSYDAEAEGF